ncbi:MAG: outer membrane beta-barrel protein [Gemmatimonadaceae bacterium]|nr:outer membrane beta-barrel protein [Gemmatimonadaceae bacterium]
MSTLRGFAAAAGAAFVLAASPAQGQVAFGIAAGATVPSGSLNDRQNLGYNGLATVQLGVPTFPLQLRADLQYNGFGGKNFTNALNQAVDGADTRIISGTVNGVFTLLQGPVKPYLIGGVGYYDTQLKGTDATRKFGYNYGAGVKFGMTGASLFIEARLHEIKDATFDVGGSRSTAKFIPISAGIMF